MSQGKIFCPHCGQDVSECEETEFGIICPKCHNDFWGSETIPESEIEGYKYFPEYNLMLKL